MTTDDKIQLLESMQGHACVSGLEYDLSDFLAFHSGIPFQQDNVGNIFVSFEGSGKNKKSVLLRDQTVAGSYRFQAAASFQNQN